MKAELQMVREFMRAFGQAVPNSPGMPDGSVQYLRHRLCTEESKELVDAIATQKGGRIYANPRVTGRVLQVGEVAA